MKTTSYGYMPTTWDGECDVCGDSEADTRGVEFIIKRGHLPSTTARVRICEGCLDDMNRSVSKAAAHGG